MRISDWSSDVCSSDLLGIVGGGIEFGPDRNHHVAVQSVDLIDHRLGVGEAGLVEIVAAPRILGPVEPVLHDIIDRDAALPVFAHHVEQLLRSEEHTSELQSLMRISYAVFCLKKKNT